MSKSWLEQAFDAVHPERREPIDFDAVAAWLKERDVFVAVDYRLQMKRREEENRSRQKAAKQAANRDAPEYTGQIKGCMQSGYVSRGTPFRCNKPAKKLRWSWNGKPMVVCSGHAYELRPHVYSGWGFDPNPAMPTVEPEEAAKLPPFEEAVL